MYQYKYTCYTMVSQVDHVVRRTPRQVGLAPGVALRRLLVLSNGQRTQEQSFWCVVC